MLIMTRIRNVVIGMALLLGAALSEAADQPTWGEAGTHNMVSTETNLPDAFDPKTGSNILWMANLGTETHSTPVISSGRVLIGSNNNKPRNPKNKGDRGVFFCFNEINGDFLWQMLAPKITNSIYWDWPNAGTCSTATVEGNRVYLVSNRGEVVCLDLFGMANGNDGPFKDESRHSTPAEQSPIESDAADADILWLFDMVKECGVRQHDSAHGTPLIVGNYLYVNTSNGVDDSHKKINAPNAPSLVVLNKQTGALVATDGLMIGPKIFHSTWSSPSLATVNGKPQIIFCGGDGIVYAFEPVAPGTPPGQATLKLIWQFDCDPTAPKENVHTYNSNRKTSPSNIKSLPVFHDNKIYVTVGGDLWWGKNEAWLQCIDATKTGKVTSNALIWSYPLERHSMSSPVIHNGLVFVGDSGHTLHCVNAADGKPFWTHEVKGEVWASPLVADGKVYFATRRGEFLVFAESKEKKLLSEINLGEPVSSTPVAANGTLFIGTHSHLYAVKKNIH